MFRSRRDEVAIIPTPFGASLRNTLAPLPSSSDAVSLLAGGDGSGRLSLPSVRPSPKPRRRPRPKDAGTGGSTARETRARLRRTSPTCVRRNGLTRGTPRRPARMVGRQAWLRRSANPGVAPRPRDAGIGSAMRTPTKTMLPTSGPPAGPWHADGARPLPPPARPKSRQPGSLGARNSRSSGFRALGAQGGPCESI